MRSGGGRGEDHSLRGSCLEDGFLLYPARATAGKSGLAASAKPQGWRSGPDHTWEVAWRWAHPLAWSLAKWSHRGSIL